MKTIGVWLDKAKAHIITTSPNGEELFTIPSEIEDYHIHGGSGTRLKGGPQDVVQDSKYLEREKHQQKLYFKNIVNKIKDVDQFVIYGPAETREKFEKELSIYYKDLHKKLKGVFKADSMTINQTKALIRDYFKSNKNYSVL